MAVQGHAVDQFGGGCGALVRKFGFQIGSEKVEGRGRVYRTGPHIASERGSEWLIRVRIEAEGFVRNKAICIALGISPDGTKETLH